MEFNSVMYKAFSTIQTARKKEALKRRFQNNVSEENAVSEKQDDVVPKNHKAENERIGRNIDTKA